MTADATPTRARAFDLKRFVDAQAPDFARALGELRAGRKQSHWMWYVFPQLRGLGSSSRAYYYGLEGLAEARAYLAHPVLGPRLLESSGALLAHAGRSAADILGVADAAKLRSCATLFALVSAPDSVFHQILTTFYAGTPDPLIVGLAGAPA